MCVLDTAFQSSGFQVPYQSLGLDGTAPRAPCSTGASNIKLLLSIISITNGDLYLLSNLEFNLHTQAAQMRKVIVKMVINIIICQSYTPGFLCSFLYNLETWGM